MEREERKEEGMERRTGGGTQSARSSLLFLTFRGAIPQAKLCARPSLGRDEGARDGEKGGGKEGTRCTSHFFSSNQRGAKTGGNAQVQLECTARRREGDSGNGRGMR